MHYGFEFETFTAIKWFVFRLHLQRNRNNAFDNASFCLAADSINVFNSAEIVSERQSNQRQIDYELVSNFLQICFKIQICLTFASICIFWICSEFVLA